jgi:hypothetical protein
MSTKPTAVASAHVCSKCGLDWERHGKRPTLATCVGLLRMEVTRLRNGPNLSSETFGKLAIGVPMPLGLEHLGHQQPSGEVKE